MSAMNAQKDGRMERFRSSCQQVGGKLPVHRHVTAATGLQNQISISLPRSVKVVAGDSVGVLRRVKPKAHREWMGFKAASRSRRAWAGQPIAAR